MWSNKGILTVSAVLTMHGKNNLSEMVELRFSINWQCKEIVSEMVICSSRVTKEIRSSSSPVVRIPLSTI